MSLRSEVSQLKSICKDRACPAPFRQIKRSGTSHLAHSPSIRHWQMATHSSPSFPFNLVISSLHVAINSITAYLKLMMVQSCLPRTIFRNTLVSSKFLKLLLGKTNFQEDSQAAHLSYFRLTFASCRSSNGRFQSSFFSILKAVLPLGPAAHGQATLHSSQITKQSNWVTTTHSNNTIWQKHER